MAGNHNVTHDGKTHRHEGPKNHLWAFILSVILTILAFWAVATETISAYAAVPLIVVLAVIQALFQFYIWMHAKEKDHQFPVLFMASGALVAVLTVYGIAGLIWF